MSPRYRWSWFLLAVLLALAWAWTGRLDFQACDVDGCVAVNRWTGSVRFHAIEDQAPPAEPDGVMVRRL